MGIEFLSDLKFENKKGFLRKKCSAPENLEFTKFQWNFIASKTDQRLALASKTVYFVELQDETAFQTTKVKLAQFVLDVAIYKIMQVQYNSLQTQKWLVGVHLKVASAR